MKKNLIKYAGAAAAGAGLGLAANAYLSSEDGKKNIEKAKKMFAHFRKDAEAKIKAMKNK